MSLFWLPIQELKATNDTLRALQMQLEKAFHIQNSGGQTNSTLTAILETKDARIATLEKEVKLLEHELDRQRDFGPRDYVTSPFLDHPLPSHSMGYKQQVSEEESGVFHVACRAPSDTLSWPQCLVFCIRQHYLYYLTSCLCHSVCSVHIPSTVLSTVCRRSQHARTYCMGFVFGAQGGWGGGRVFLFRKLEQIYDRITEYISQL